MELGGLLSLDRGTALVVKPHQYTRLLLEMSSQMRGYSAAVLAEIDALRDDFGLAGAGHPARRTHSKVTEAGA